MVVIVGVGDVNVWEKEVSCDFINFDSRSFTTEVMGVALLCLSATVAASGRSGTANPHADPAASCIAAPSQVVEYGGARFTVLTERVIRMQVPPYDDRCSFTGTVLHVQTLHTPAPLHTRAHS